MGVSNGLSSIALYAWNGIIFAFRRSFSETTMVAKINHCG